jgi:hypothetical protein
MEALFSTSEALVCREALALAEDLSLKRIAVMSDCWQVIDDISAQGDNMLQ